MSALATPHQTPSREPAQRLHRALVAALVGVAAASWAVTEVRASGMAHGPGLHVGALPAFVVSWVLMMAAMMLPSVAPMVLAHARISRRRAGRAAPDASAAFVGGYLAAWSAYGLAAYAVIAVVAALAPGFGWDSGGRLLAGAAVVAAGAYQLTPAKRRCLRHCRSPFAFFLDGWRDGRLGAAAMGARHGAWCIGCCWGLMVALFALGMMSLGWMALVAAVVAAEKLLPRPHVTVPATALALVLLGLVLAFAPGVLGMDGGGHGMG